MSPRLRLMRLPLRLPLPRRQQPHRSILLNFRR
jgi:hypothetical protein